MVQGLNTITPQLELTASHDEPENTIDVEDQGNKPANDRAETPVDQAPH